MSDFTQHWHWPQWTMAACALFTLVGAAIRHGQPQEPVSFPIKLIDIVLTVFLLICGGFFA